MSLMERIFGVRRREGAQLDRDTLNTMADFENSLLNARRKLGYTAQAFDGRIKIEGPAAPQIAEILTELHRRSKSFHMALEDSFRREKFFFIRSAYGGKKKPSWSTMGQQEERIYINIDQVKDTRFGLTALLAHEFGHAAAGLKDGAAGRAGPNQIWLGGVLAELGLPDIKIPGYGYDLG